MMNVINLRQNCSLPSKGRAGVGSFNLNRRRKQVGLSPMEDYIRIMNENFPKKR
jgi:hypothetical protein